MDEEIEYGSPTEHLDAQGMLGQLTRRYMGLDQREMQAHQQLEQSRAEKLRLAQERIKQARFGPSQSEQMFALSSAFIAPKPYRGIAGTIANLAPTLGKLASARAQGEEYRQEQLAKLEAAHATQGLDTDLEAVGRERENLEALMKIYGPLAKPRSRRTAIDPSSGRVLDLDTGEEVVPPSSVPQGAVDQLLAYVQNPSVSEENRRAAMQNFERRFRVSPSMFLNGGR